MMLRKQLRLLAILPFLLCSCQADDPTAQGETEPGVLASDHLVLGHRNPQGLHYDGNYGWALFSYRRIADASSSCHPVDSGNDEVTRTC